MIEGILMRGPKRTEVAVRLEDGTISTEEMKTKSLKDKYKIWRDVYKRQHRRDPALWPRRRAGCG